MISAGGIGTRTSTSSTSTTSNTPPTSEEITSALNTYERAFFPGQPKSLSGIALRAFLLGLSLAGSTALTTYLLYNTNPLWRAPFFLASLSLFHFLEFYSTALTNAPGARVSSFLLSSNGSAYNIAHGAAFTELLLSHLFLPASILPYPLHPLLLLTGLLLIIIGQSTRTLAMLHAGSNFSHIVSHTKKSSHELVTTGIYSILRHPSYFGFFWWGIGTQLVCGNVVCLMGYAVVLWRFFERRIGGEEELLVGFFGEEYVKFRERTRVGIPFIK
ncbi:S-isoprenylcysteine O-methyltransferase [Halenospora varia]|nr:S-isoprenylcysteine O-methyltransferase [Halenospora varia]